MCVAALGILGGVISGIGGAMQASQQAASLRAQAEAEKRQAAIEQTTGAYKAQRQQEQVDRVLGQQRAAYGGSGLALTGTPEDVISESAEEGALDVAAIRWSSNLASDNLRYQSKITSMSAKNAQRAAPLAFITPVIGSVARFGQSFG